MRYERSITASAATCAYLLLQMLWIVAIDQSISYGGDLWTVGVFSVIGLACLGLGLATGWWGAPALPVLTILLAIPLGLPEGTLHEPLPIWFGMLLLAPVEAVLIALGVVGRTLWDRWRAPRPA